MVVIDKQKASRYFVIGVFLISIIMSIFLIYPYITPVLTSIILAYLFYPVHKWLLKKIKHPQFTAFIITAFILLVITIPTIFIIIQITHEVQVILVTTRQALSTSFLDGTCNNGALCSVQNAITQVVDEETAKFYIEDSLASLAKTITDKAVVFLYSVPKRFLDLLITFFMTYFLLVDGDKLVKFIEEAIPLKKKQKTAIFKKMHEVTHGVVYGLFIMALIQGVIAMITFSVFGMYSPLFWALLVAIFAFIPMIGSTVIYIPIVIYMLMDGHPVAAIGILAGGLVISFIDTFIKPKMVGDRSAMHPVLMLLGMIGGLHLLGIIGFIFGPLILTLFLTFFKMYKKVSR